LLSGIFCFIASAIGPLPGLNSLPTTMADEPLAATDASDASVRPVVTKAAPSESSPTESAPEVERHVHDALFRATPVTVGELTLLEERVQEVIKKALPATVAVRIGQAMGSGIIVSEDGYVLSAGHVCMKPDMDAVFILPDGRRVRGKTLGVNRSMDSGMLKITDEGTWPYVELGTSSDLEPGTWALALGHPGGFKNKRPPVLRLGRVIESQRMALRTDCPLSGGDSGGPLFDLDGRVIAIHSRIGGPTSANFHVPVDTYQNTWERLAAGEDWGNELGSGGPYLGVTPVPDDKGAKILRVEKDSAAEKAGLEEDDIITHFGDHPVKNLNELRDLIEARRAGDKVTLQVIRGGVTLEIEAELGKRK
jgi:serine protease Do